MPHSFGKPCRRYRLSMVLIAVAVILGVPRFSGLARATFDVSPNTADAVLGQKDFTKAGVNFVDQFSLNVGQDTGVAINLSKTTGTFGVTSQALRTEAGSPSVWTAHCGSQIPAINRVLGTPIRHQFCERRRGELYWGSPISIPISSTIRAVNPRLHRTNRVWRVRPRSRSIRSPETCGWLIRRTIASWSLRRHSPMAWRQARSMVRRVLSLPTAVAIRRQPQPLPVLCASLKGWRLTVLEIFSLQIPMTIACWSSMAGRYLLSMPRRPWWLARLISRRKSAGMLLHLRPLCASPQELRSMPTIIFTFSIRPTIAY